MKNIRVASKKTTKSVKKEPVKAKKQAVKLAISPRKKVQTAEGWRRAMVKQKKATKAK